jgi:CRP-like cAMP-binding protein
MKKFYLGLKKERLQKSIYPLEGSVTIGRSSENDIALVDWQVSRAHARISFQQNSWVIEDLGSANGVIFGDERVTKKVLKAGDIFQIGGATLRFMDEDFLEKTGQLSNTVQVFAAMIKYQSPVLEFNQTNPGFMRLQGALLSTPIFSSLGKKEVRGLEDIANLHLFSGDQLIFREGDPGRSTYIILDGRVKVFTKDQKGGEFQLATLEPNQFFGEMALLTGKPRSSSVATIEETLLGEISYRNMQRLMVRYPQIKEVLLQYFRERVEDSRKKRTEANIHDRRLEPRFNERLMVRFTVWPTETLPEGMINHTYKATASDISLSGIQLELMGPGMKEFNPGFRLQLEIELSARFGKVQTQAIVRHVIQGKNTVKLGISFVETSADDKKKLQEFLYGQTTTIE